jgi:hypothetical protein
VNALVGHDGLSERRVGGCQYRREQCRLPDGQATQEQQRRTRSDGDRERQADSHQARRERGTTPQRAEVDARGVRGQRQCKRNLDEHQTDVGEVSAVRCAR